MPDLGFSDLRASIEQNTYLPEFQEVTRRARKHTRRRRLATTAKILGVLTVATPGLIVAGVVIDHVSHAQTITIVGLDDGNNNSVPVPTPKPKVITRTVVAADGIDMAHSYGLVDVCSAGICNLQLSQISPPTESNVTQRLGLLRQRPTDTLTDPRIVVVNADTVIISAVVGQSARVYQTLNVTTAAGTINSAPRPIQTTVQGAIRVVKGPYGQPATLVHQPPVSEPVLESETAGWWVCGTTPDNGELAVSVSRDDGRTWSTHPLGLLPDAVTASASPTLPRSISGGPVLATSNGVDVYVLVTSGGQMVLTRSGNGGLTWSPTATAEVWPTGTSYGMVAKPDGSLLVWFTNDGVTTYLRSVDHGETFLPDTGPLAPGGTLVQVRDGFISLGTEPATSRDGATWAAAFVPYVGTVN